MLAVSLSSCYLPPHREIHQRGMEYFNVDIAGELCVRIDLQCACHILSTGLHSPWCALGPPRRCLDRPRVDHSPLMHLYKD